MLLALLEKVLLHGQQLPLLFVASFLFRCCHRSRIRCWLQCGCRLRRRLRKWLRGRLGVNRLTLLWCLLLCIPVFLLFLVILLLLPTVQRCVVPFSTVFAVDGNFESRWWMFLRPLPASSTFDFAAVSPSTFSFSFATAFAFSFAFASKQFGLSVVLRVVEVRVAVGGLIRLTLHRQGFKQS